MKIKRISGPIAGPGPILSLHFTTLRNREYIKIYKFNLLALKIVILLATIQLISLEVTVHRYGHIILYV